MKILLIYPSVTIYGPGKIDPHPPLGLAYLAAYLIKQNKYEVKILDALALGKDSIIKTGKLTRVGLKDEQIEKMIKEFNPDVVGISIMFTAFAQDGLKTAKIVKKVNRKIITVLGGAHVSIDPKSIVNNSYVDFAVKGEGEITFHNLLQAIKNKKPLRNVTGIIYKSRNRILENKTTPFIDNLDKLPFPARNLLPMALYDNPDDLFSMRHPATTMVTSRGCPGVCIYCSIHAIWGHTWRGRSAENVVDEIEYLVKDYGIKEIYFQDDSMSIDKKRLMQICDLIISRNIDIKWSTPNGIAHWTLDKSLLKKMKQAGCYRVTFGIESGNPEIRRWVGKPFSLRQARELTKYANKIGLWTVATNIIGFPYETRQQIEDTINFAIDSDVDFALFFRLGPRPGTLVYEIFKKEGWLPKDQRLLFSESVSCRTKFFQKKELYSIQSQAYRKFLKYRVISFFNPLRLLRKIHSIEDIKYISKLFVGGGRMVLNLLVEEKGVTSKALKG